MAGEQSGERTSFYVELIKPSHYDDDGYVIQWWRAWIPSNSLSCLYGLALDVAERQALGTDVDIVVSAYDECNTVLPLRKIINRIKDNHGRGLVCLAGVQSNQYPRAVDIARQLRAHGIQVAIGGFHVSGCISMLPELPDDLREALDMGVTLFAGEAEGRLEKILQAAYERRLEPLYNFMADLPHLEGQPTPFLRKSQIRRYGGTFGCFDAGRGCPFACSFCTIINVQGRKSRYRTADDIEQLIRVHAAQGVHKFFITDDNFARNKNWESIFDRIIELRGRDNLVVHFVIQVDTLCHKIPGFVEKAARAGCKRVFIGLENINPENLKAAMKGQNRITEYRRMLQAWRNAGVITYCGYILGFPGDTPQSIARDIEIVKRELPVDLLEFFILTPLPGSADHRDLYTAGVWMDPDMNKYDLEHVTTDHATMLCEELQGAYRDAWDQYYSPQHVRTLLKRAVASGIKAGRLSNMIFQFYGSLVYESVHPLQGGFLRYKVRTQRRHGMPRENPLIFYPRRVWEIVRTYVPGALYFYRLRRLRKRIAADPANKHYTDAALQPVDDATGEDLEMFTVTAGARAAVKKAKNMNRILESVGKGRSAPAEASNA